MTAGSIASTDQVAQLAEVLDPAALERMGLLTGTTLDGRLVMSRSDWGTALSCGAVRIAATTPLPSA